MTEQMNVPKLRFGEFGSEWETKKIKDICPLQRGFDLPTTQVVAGEYPVVYSNGIGRFHAEYKAKGPGIVTGRSGTIGSLTFVEHDYWPHNTSLWVTNFFDNDVKYIFYLLSKLDLKRFSTGSGVPTLNRNDVHDHKIAIPQPPEQQKIASFLSKVDEKIALLTEKKDKLTEYKKGVMQQLFNGKWEEQDGRLTFIPPTLRFKADDGSEFPDWEEKKGAKLFASISNKDHNSDLPVLAITQNQGAIPRSLIDYNISVADTSVASYKVVEKGDFIISLRSFQGGIEYSEYTGICSPAYVILRPKIDISDYFYKYYLKTYPFIVEMQKRLEGIRDGKIISYKYFSEISMPYPTKVEQDKIVCFLSALEQKISLATSELEKAKEWKRGLLQQMFV